MGSRRSSDEPVRCSTTKVRESKSLSKVFHYLSLPRRKNKKIVQPMEISSPTFCTGTLLDWSVLPNARSSSSLDISDPSMTSHRQPCDSSLKLSDDSDTYLQGSKTLDQEIRSLDQISSSKQSGDGMEFQRSTETRQTFHYVSSSRGREVSDSVDGRQSRSSQHLDEIHNVPEISVLSSRFSRTYEKPSRNCVSDPLSAKSNRITYLQNSTRFSENISDGQACKRYAVVGRDYDNDIVGFEDNRQSRNALNDSTFNGRSSSGDDYDFPKSNIHNCVPVDPRNHNPISEIVKGGRNEPSVVQGLDFVTPKPPLEPDYDTPKPLRGSEYGSPRANTEPDYDIPNSVHGPHHGIPKTAEEYDYDTPRSLHEVQDVSKRIAEESDYDIPKPSQESKLRSPRVLLELDYDSQSAAQSDYDFPRALRKSKLDPPSAAEESNNNFPRVKQESNGDSSRLTQETDYDFPRAVNVQSTKSALESSSETNFLDSDFAKTNLDPDSERDFPRTNSESLCDPPKAAQESDYDTRKAFPENDLFLTTITCYRKDSDCHILKSSRDSGFESAESSRKSDISVVSHCQNSLDSTDSGFNECDEDSQELNGFLEGEECMHQFILDADQLTQSCRPTSGGKTRLSLNDICVDGATIYSNRNISNGPKPSFKINGLDFALDPLYESDDNTLPDRPEDSNLNDNKNCVARALYSNTAESPDELEFRKDDCLTVLEQNTGGLEGWWLCSLRGMQGICPGNRLRIIPGLYDTGTGVPTTLVRPHPPAGMHAPAATTMPRSIGNKVVTPRRVGDTYTYDTSRRHVASTPAPPLTHYPTLDYDVPRGPPVINSEGPRLSRSSSLRYEAPRHMPRGSYELHDVPTSSCDQQSSMHYDIPRPQANAMQSALYDSPRPHGTLGAGGANEYRAGVAARSLIKGIRGPQPAMCISATSVKLPESDSGQYDVPKPLHEVAQLDVPTASDRSSAVSIMSCDSTSSSASSAAASDSPYLSSIGGSSNRSSLEVQDVYDVPPEPRRVGTVQKPRLLPRESTSRPQSEASPDKNTAKEEAVYDVPPQVSRDARTSTAGDMSQTRVSSEAEGVCDNALFGPGLPLEYDSAIDMLSKLQQDVHVSLEKLVNFNVVVSPVKPVSDERFSESKMIIDRLKDALQEFIKFTKGAAVNAYKAGYEMFAKTVQQQVDRLVSTYDMIMNTWSCAQHEREEALDMVHHLTSIMKPLGDDVRHLANLIHSNAPQIFKRTPSGEQTKQKTDTKSNLHERPTHDVGNVYANESAILEDYDYVKLESRETADREHQQIKESLPANLRKSYDNLVKQSHSVVDNDHQKVLTTSTPASKNLNSAPVTSRASRLDANDRQVLAFYSNQAEQHIQHLNTAIDAFFLTIEENQPPKVFIAHSKFVILSAHKLVFIGDTVHRNVVNSEVRSCVLNCSNALCDAMKNTVAAAKTAAIQFPSVTAVQAMVDSFTTISNLACNLRNAICRN